MSGIGWLPVEVVPGMYTETYTDQVIEGTPSWEVNTKQDDEGVKTEVGNVIGEQGEEEDTKGHVIPGVLRHFAGLIIFILYLLVVVWLLAELQRLIRCRALVKNEEEPDQKKRIDFYVRELFLLLQIAGISGDYSHPLTLSGQVESEIRTVRRQDYEKVIALIQKVRFGSCALAPWEERIVRVFTERVRKGIYKKSGCWRKIWLRYRYAL